MSALLGADTRRVVLMAEGLQGHAQDIQDLRALAQRAVAEMRSAWGGPDFERVAQRWEQEAGPRLTDVSSALSTMATALQAQADAQRQASGNTVGSSLPLGTGGTAGGRPGGGGGASSWGGGGKQIEDLDPDDVDARMPTVSEHSYDNGDKTTHHGKLGPVETLTIGTTNGNQTDTSASTYINGHKVGIEESRLSTGGDGVSEPRLGEHVSVNLAQGNGTLVDESVASVASLTGEGEAYDYELSAGKVEAKVDYSIDVDAGGNLVASAGASAAAYAGYAAGKVAAGNDFAKVAAGGRAYVGAEVKADASGAIGPSGARGHLGAAAFVGAKAEANVSGMVAGVTATAGAEISYGIGAHADVDAELSTTNVGVSVDIGATLGIGAGVKLDASVNPVEVIANVGHAVDDVNHAAQDIGEGLAFAGDQVASLVHW